MTQGHTHPLLDTDTPLPPLPAITSTASLAIQSFVIHCLPTCSFLTPARIHHLFERYTTSPTSLGSDQLALIYACLACGYVRLQYFGSHERNATPVPQDQREDVPWYRHAVHTLTTWGSATFTSLRELASLGRPLMSRRSISHVVLYNIGITDSQPIRRLVARQPGKRAWAAS
jgi:hypothetical protein